MRLQVVLRRMLKHLNASPFIGLNTDESTDGSQEEHTAAVVRSVDSMSSMRTPSNWKTNSTLVEREAAEEEFLKRHVYQNRGEEQIENEQLKFHFYKPDEMFIKLFDGGNVANKLVYHVSFSHHDSKIQVFVGIIATAVRINVIIYNK